MAIFGIFKGDGSHILFTGFMNLFDKTFFKMAFQFLAIVIVAFIILLLVGSYEAGGRSGNSSGARDQSMVGQ